MSIRWRVGDWLCRHGHHRYSEWTEVNYRRSVTFGRLVTWARSCERCGWSENQEMPEGRNV